MSEINKAIEYIAQLNKFVELSNIDEFFNHMQGHKTELSLILSLMDNERENAIKIILTALTEKAERGQNEPLTLEQLKEMDGQPVWCNGISGMVLCGVVGMRGNIITITFVYGWETARDVIGKCKGRIYKQPLKQGQA